MSRAADRSRPTLVLGTANRKKAGELVDLLAPLDFEVATLADFPPPLEVDECGTSFLENATLKAVTQARHLNRWVLGDDSGLAVDALGGAPGIFSARYARAGASDLENRQRLLAELDQVSEPKRTAHFVCTLVLADPQGNVRATAEGRCQGRLRRDDAGSGGFGYDPLFEVLEYHRTFGELSAAVKGCISHRARAVYALLPQLDALARRGAWSRS
jgi:XTP/dITP diphosphohydrolase